jgi:hypothetical protein
MRIFVSEVRHGCFEARDEQGKLLCVSRQPFLEAARVLLALGVSPETELIMVAANGTERLKAKIGVAAKLTVEEGNRPPYFRPWKPIPHATQKASRTAAVAPPIALPLEGVPSLAPDDTNEPVSTISETVN